MLVGGSSQPILGSRAPRSVHTWAYFSLASETVTDRIRSFYFICLSFFSAASSPHVLHAGSVLVREMPISSCIILLFLSHKLVDFFHWSLYWGQQAEPHTLVTSS